MHTTSVGLAKAAWLHNETQVPTQTWQLKTQSAKHMYAKDKRGAIRCWLPSQRTRRSHMRKRHDTDLYSGHERGNIPRKTPFSAKRWTWRMFSKHKKHDTEVRLYSYVCSLGFNAWSALAQKYTGCWQSSWSWKSLKSDFILFVSQVFCLSLMNICI